MKHYSVIVQVDDRPEYSALSMCYSKSFAKQIKFVYKTRYPEARVWLRESL